MNSTLWMTLIKAIIIPLIGIYLATKFNIFEYFSFVPEDQKFKVAITAYFALLECLYVKLSNEIRKRCYANVECTFYCDKQSMSIENTPQLTFVDDVAYIHCLLSIKGGASKLAKNSLIISFPHWVEIQNANSSIGVVNNNKFMINFSKIISANDKVVEKATADFKIGLIKMPSNDVFAKIIAPSLSKKFMYKLSANKFELRNK